MNGSKYVRLDGALLLPTFNIRKLFYDNFPGLSIGTIKINDMQAVMH